MEQLYPGWPFSPPQLLYEIYDSLSVTQISKFLFSQMNVKGSAEYKRWPLFTLFLRKGKITYTFSTLWRYSWVLRLRLLSVILLEYWRLLWICLHKMTKFVVIEAEMLHDSFVPNHSLTCVLFLDTDEFL